MPTKRKRLTEEEKQGMAEFHADHPACWMCVFLDVRKPGTTELHHIAGRGRRHHVRENYAALCQRHHAAIQGRMDAELICLVLKYRFDKRHYAPETICDLRGRADSCWTFYDIDRCRRIMEMMKACHV